MKTLNLIIIFLFLEFYSLSQHVDTLIITSISYGERKTDTISYLNSAMKENYLVGTDVLWNEKTYFTSMNGVILDKVFFSECELDYTKKPPHFGGDKISSIEIKDSLMLVHTNIVGNCCHNFLCDVELKSDTLNLGYIGYGDYCGCTCCFGITYKIIVWDFEDINYIMIKNNKETMRKIE